MSKINAPLMSFGASGQIGGSLVFARWRGVPYVRQRVIPSNPRTVAQMATRNAFSLFSAIWLYMPELWKAPWNTFALGRPFTGRNRFQGENVRYNRGEEDISALFFSPGARGGIPPAGATFTPDDAEVDVTVDLPAVPDGWTLTGATAVAITNVDPNEPWDGEIVAVQETVTPEAFSITGLTNGTEYVCGVWLVWQKPNGETAYSVALSDTATPTGA